MRCTGASPSLLYTSPAPGWELDDSRVEGGRVEVRFRTDKDDVRVRVRCIGGTPTEVDE